MRLQTQLTFSHLAVTAISLIILLIGLLAGYAIYLRSDLSAAWAGDAAYFYAFDLANADSLEAYVDSQFLPISAEPNLDQWLVVTDRIGSVIATNYPERFPQDSKLLDTAPKGLSRRNLFDPAIQFGIDWYENNNIVFFNTNGRHIGLAPLTDKAGQWTGWVYYYGGDEDIALSQQQLAYDALRASAGVGVIALFISGLMGFWLAGRFGRKLTVLTQTSAAFAAGQFDQRVAIIGEDEISRVGTQFNRMADTIADQMGDLRQLADDNARLAAGAEGLARLEERNHLARELHDAVKQQLFGLNLTLGSIQPLLTSKPAIAQQRIEQVIGQTQQIQLELDHIIKQLRPVSLTDQGLVAAVQALADQWALQTDIPVRVTAQQQRPLPIEFEQPIYRLIQEALQNIGKHAEAETVSLVLTYTKSAIKVEIMDDGVGFRLDSAETHAGHGLKNMHDRITQLNGTLTIDTQPNQGCHISAEIPV